MSRSLTAGDPQGAIRECLSTSPELHQPHLQTSAQTLCDTCASTPIHAFMLNPNPSTQAKQLIPHTETGTKAAMLNPIHPLLLTEDCTGPATLNPHPNTVPTRRDWSKSSNAEPHSKHPHQNWHRAETLNRSKCVKPSKRCTALGSACVANSVGLKRRSWSCRRCAGSSAASVSIAGARGSWHSWQTSGTTYRRSPSACRSMPVTLFAKWTLGSDSVVRQPQKISLPTLCPATAAPPPGFSRRAARQGRLSQRLRLPAQALFQLATGLQLWC